MVSKKRVMVYIDGSNFYFSIKNMFGIGVDIGEFCRKLIGNNELVKINYYISPVGDSNLKMYSEQQRFFEKLKKINKLRIVFGRLEKHKKDGKIFYVEKATDINLAQDLIFDSMDDLYDEAYLVSNDGDFSGVVSSVVKRFGKEIIYVAVGNKKSISYHLKKVSSSTFVVDKKFIEDVKIE